MSGLSSESQMPASASVRVTSSGGRPDSTASPVGELVETANPARSSTPAASPASGTVTRYDVPAPSRSSTPPLASSRPLPMIVAEVHTCCTSPRMCELSSTVTPVSPR